MFCFVSPSQRPKALLSCVVALLMLVLAVPAVAAASARPQQQSSLKPARPGAVFKAGHRTRTRPPHRSSRRSHPRAQAASTPDRVRPGMLGCDVLDGFSIRVTGNAPAVAATNRTSGVDSERVYFRSRLYQFGGVDILNGTGWYPAGDYTGWQSQIAYDYAFSKNWHGWYWDLLRGPDFAVYNEVYFSSTGRTVAYWSSDAYGYRVKCGISYISRF